MKLSQNKVAILLSTFNGERYICEQLDSLLTSTVSADIYIRDDGSHDSTREILAGYASEHANIKLMAGDNIGVVGSFFNLISYVNDKDYDFYCFCDQDDFWEKEKKQSQSGFIFRFSSGIVFLSVFRTGDYEMYRKNRVLACFVAFTYGSADRRRFYRACPKKSQPDRAGDPGAGFDRSYCCFWDRNDKSRKFRKSL